MSTKREVHINSPVWNGDRSQVFVGIAKRRVLDKKGSPARGNIRVWIDYEERDTASSRGWKLIYPFPFDIKCSDVLKYREQVLNDYNHTVLHIVPISGLHLVKNYRSGSERGRTMPQSDFYKLKQDTVQVAEQIRQEQPKQEPPKAEQPKLF
jgi:hypothetical protein